MKKNTIFNFENHPYIFTLSICIVASGVGRFRKDFRKFYGRTDEALLKVQYTNFESLLIQLLDWSLFNYNSCYLFVSDYYYMKDHFELISVVPSCFVEITSLTLNSPCTAIRTII